MYVNYVRYFRPLFARDSEVGVVAKPRHVLVGVGSVESSFMIRNVPAIKDPMDEDLAPLKLFYQYLTQLEVDFSLDPLIK